MANCPGKSRWKPGTSQAVNYDRSSDLSGKKLCNWDERKFESNKFRLASGINLSAVLCCCRNTLSLEGRQTKHGVCWKNLPFVLRTRCISDSRGEFDGISGIFVFPKRCLSLELGAVACQLNTGIPVHRYHAKASRSNYDRVASDKVAVHGYFPLQFPSIWMSLARKYDKSTAIALNHYTRICTSLTYKLRKWTALHRPVN